MPPSFIAVHEVEQQLPPASRKLFVAVDENGLRIGETHHMAKLTDVQVDQIRDLREHDGITYPELARRFGVTTRSIKSICDYSRRATTVARWEVVIIHQSN